MAQRQARIDGKTVSTYCITVSHYFASSTKADLAKKTYISHTLQKIYFMEFFFIYRSDSFVDCNSIQLLQHLRKQCR